MKIPLNPYGDIACHHLSQETLELAATYLAGTYRQRLVEPPVLMRVEPGESPESNLRRRGKLTIQAAELAELAILPQERLAGAATYKSGMLHLVPGLRQANGEPVSSISHTTIDFGDAVTNGLSGLEAEIRQRMETTDTDEQQAFCEALLDNVQAMRIWVERYKTAYGLLMQSSDFTESQKDNFRTIIKRLEQVPENPPCHFDEALQSYWLFFEYERLNGNWSGLGRFDKILGRYLRQDLANGYTTLGEARELIAHFWIKGTEWCHGLRSVNNLTPGSGDAQNYQNIVLGGIDENGELVENEVTYLVLDVVEELHISDFPIAVRISERTSPELLKRIAQVQLLGGGIVSVYNEQVVMDGLRRLGCFSEQEVRSFTNDGCWEVIIPGQSRFTYIPLDILSCFQDALFAAKTPNTFEELYASYLQKLQALIEKTTNERFRAFYKPVLDDAGTPTGEWDSHHDCDVALSFLCPSCRKSAMSYQNNGTKYILQGIHGAGLPDVANSLRAIQEFVFRRKLLTLAELVDILRQDWEGHEDLRQLVHRSIRYYGNDDEKADAMMKRVHEDYAAAIGLNRRRKAVIFVPGISTFGREIAFASHRLATAFGVKAHEYLAPNLAPTPGTDLSPITAIINSYCKMDLAKTPNGCPLDLRISSQLKNNPAAAEKLAAVLAAFTRLGGWYLQIDAIDADMLRLAQENPDRFPNLVVRISGWSARFATLDRDWQNLMIRRTIVNL